MKQKFTPYIYILFSMLVFNHTYGQKLVLNISSTDSTSTLLLQDIHFQKLHFTENSLLKSLDSVKLKIEEMGFVDYRLVEKPPLAPPQEGDSLTMDKNRIAKTPPPDPKPAITHQKEGDSLTMDKNRIAKRHLPKPKSAITHPKKVGDSLTMDKNRIAKTHPPDPKPATTPQKEGDSLTMDKNRIAKRHLPKPKSAIMPQKEGDSLTMDKNRNAKTPPPDLKPAITPQKEGDSLTMGKNRNAKTLPPDPKPAITHPKKVGNVIVKKSPPPSPLRRRGNTLVKNDTVYTAYFDLRSQIQKIRIYYDDNEVDYNQNTDLKGKSSLGYFEVIPEMLSKKLQDITNTLEKEGNSFSEVSLKNISIKNDSIIEADLFIEKSTLRKIDKIIINGYAAFPKTYLEHHLRLKPNILFNKEKLDEVSSAINRLPFVSEIKPPEILFTKDSTIAYLYLKKENTNRFDGLIGFTSNETGKGLSLNGYLDLSLNNLFNSGENFNLIWKNNGNNRQVFNLDISLPYVFKSKISPNMALNIYKQDSSFVNTTFKVALPYSINNRNSIGLILRSESSSNLLTISDNSIEDYNNLFYGVNYNYLIPNNHPLFKTKFNFYTEALTGKRKSTTNNDQSKFFIKAHYLWSLNHKNHFFLQNKSGIINSDNLYNNELLRIGGTNTIRGFDEESILASTYSIFNIEYRHNPNVTSYLYSITDVGYVDNKNNNSSSQIYAFGLGYAFTSKLGLVNLSYALGKFSDAPFNFDNSRFHLKILNLF